MGRRVGPGRYPVRPKRNGIEAEEVPLGVPVDLGPRGVRGPLAEPVDPEHPERAGSLMSSRVQFAPRLDPCRGVVE